MYFLKKTILFLFLFSFSSANAMQLSVEEVISVVSSVGFPPPTVPIMTCIAHHESSFRPTVLNYNTNHTIDYGFLQVNTIWLKPCHATPQSILNVYVNAKCAFLVYHQQGLTAWVTFRKFRSECLAYKVPNLPLSPKEEEFLVSQKKELL